MVLWNLLTFLNFYLYNYGGYQEVVVPSSLDLNAEQGPNFNNGIDSTLHNPDSLLEQYQYSYGQNNNPFGNSQGQAGPSDLDLNGVSTIGEATFDNGMNSTLHTDLLANIYNSSINPGASYGQGQPGSIWPSVKPPPIQSNPSSTGMSYADLDGLQPTGYVNPDTGQGY